VAIALSRSTYGNEIGPTVKYRGVQRRSGPTYSLLTRGTMFLANVSIYTAAGTRNDVSDGDGFIVTGGTAAAHKCATRLSRGERQDAFTKRGNLTFAVGEKAGPAVSAQDCGNFAQHISAAWALAKPWFNPMFMLAAGSCTAFYLNCRFDRLSVRRSHTNKL
jgi:hypothetical protein